MPENSVLLLSPPTVNRLSPRLITPLLRSIPPCHQLHLMRSRLLNSQCRSITQTSAHKQRSAFNQRLTRIRVRSAQCLLARSDFVIPPAQMQRLKTPYCCYLHQPSIALSPRLIAPSCDRSHRVISSYLIRSDSSTVNAVSSLKLPLTSSVPPLINV